MSYNPRVLLRVLRGNTLNKTLGFRELQRKNDPYKTPKYSGGRSPPLYSGVLYGSFFPLSFLSTCTKKVTETRKVAPRRGETLWVSVCN